jgi:hypothetical protein
MVTTVALTILFSVAIIGGIVQGISEARAESEGRKSKPGSYGSADETPDYVWNGVKRTGRVGLWVALPPVGLWRSVRHGKKQHERRLAKEIAKELRREGMR